MGQPSPNQLQALWAWHDDEWRDPEQIVSQWHDAARVDPRLLSYSVHGAWWDVLHAANITLLVTREYEHLVVALGATRGEPTVSFMSLPHPSGLTVDRDQGIVHIASTRNPNQVYDLRPVSALLPRKGVGSAPLTDHPLVPIRSRFFPGCIYMHDLAMVGGILHANAVGQNAVVRLEADGRHDLVWWPRCIETGTGPATDRNYLQLNSIAAGPTLATSFFSASTDRISVRRPGHRNFAVDRRGVIFSGATGEPIVRGLTRPHSARLLDGRLWVDNSGYGEVGLVDDGRFVAVARLPGWTRGLCLRGRTAFVGTSRVIPRFRHYAPGLDPDDCICGIHALDVVSGEVLGSLIWPYGNQVFAIDWVHQTWTTGFPFTSNDRRAPGRERAKALFYAFQAVPQNEHGKQEVRRSAFTWNSKVPETEATARSGSEKDQTFTQNPLSEGK